MTHLSLPTCKNENTNFITLFPSALKIGRKNKHPDTDGRDCSNIQFSENILLELDFIEDWLYITSDSDASFFRRHRDNIELNKDKKKLLFLGKD